MCGCPNEFYLMLVVALELQKVGAKFSPTWKFGRKLDHLIMEVIPPLGN
jgi:hypothetical protein